MNYFKLFFCVIIISVFLGCSRSLEKKIIGTWKEVKKSQIIEFFSEGTVQISVRKNTFVGKYSFIGENRIKIELGEYASGASEIKTISFDNDVLVFTDIRGNASRYERFEIVDEGLGKSKIKTPKKKTDGNIESDLKTLGTIAQQYYRKPTATRGGGNSFRGWEIPNILAKTENASYSISKITPAMVEIIGRGKHGNVLATITPSNVQLTDYEQSKIKTPKKKTDGNLKSDLLTLSSIAHLYYRKPTALGGGGFSFEGWEIPNTWVKTENGSYSISKITPTIVKIIGRGKHGNVLATISRSNTQFTDYD